MKQPCEHHKKLDLGYVQWHVLAGKRINQKYTQVKCINCGLYLFPDELNEPDNKNAQQVIDRHAKYLEEHPKAKDVLKI